MSCSHIACMSTIRQSRQSWSSTEGAETLKWGKTTFTLVKQPFSEYLRELQEFISTQDCWCPVTQSAVFKRNQFYNWVKSGPGITKATAALEMLCLHMSSYWNRSSDTELRWEVAPESSEDITCCMWFCFSFSKSRCLKQSLAKAL